MNGTLSGLMLSVLLSGMLMLALDVQPVGASGNIYIRADGGIDPPLANITSSDNVTYYFTDNNYDSIIVEKNNIIIDGAGYGIEGAGSGIGVQLSHRNNVTIRNVRIEAFSEGIRLYRSTDSAIVGNHITVQEIGVYLYLSSNNRIEGNYIRDATLGRGGIYLYWDSNNNRIAMNHITHCSNGVQLGYSSENTIERNNLTGNGDGILVHYYSDNNTIIENNIHSNNWHGIWLTRSMNNRIFKNNFEKNFIQVSVSSPNYWDDGYPSGGNYWLDYTGADLFSGPYQNETGSDGIGDTPYILEADNLDRYPLLIPWRKPLIQHDIGIVVSCKLVVGQGCRLRIFVETTNYGVNTESFNVTVYVDDDAISNVTGITLEGRSSTTVAVAWNTSGIAIGEYVVKARATIVPGEEDTSDNSYTMGHVHVSIIGDIAGPSPWGPDGVVDIRDLATAAKAFGSYLGHSRWNANADIDDDEKVDIRDIAIVASNYGKIIL